MGCLEPREREREKERLFETRVGRCCMKLAVLRFRHSPFKGADSVRTKITENNDKISKNWDYQGKENRNKDSILGGWWALLPREPFVSHILSPSRDIDS